MSSASPNVEWARAVTCQSPVIPAGTRKRSKWCGSKVLGLVREARARSDERHLAPQHVEQLRQLVEARLAQPAPDARDLVLRSSLYRPLSATVALALIVWRMYSRWTLSSVSTVIVRNFSAMNSRMSLPSRSCRNRTGPAESRLIRSAISAKAGAVTQERERRANDVDQALDHLRRPRRPHGRQADEGERLDRVVRDLRANDLEEPRDDVDLDVEVAERAHQCDPLDLRRSEKAITTRSTSSRLTSGTTSAVGPSNGTVREVVTPRARMVVDEADDVDAVLGMLAQLARDELTDVARADDDRVLDVHDAAPGGGPRDGAADDDQEDREDPEPGELLEGRGGHAGDPPPRNSSHAPTVTRWNTPTRSSTVEWSARSSSRS